MKSCPRPLDPIDAEAVSAGADPVFAADAATHARDCPSCQEMVQASERLTVALQGLLEADHAVPGLPERVLRLRAFSRRERRTYALWRAPILLDLSLGLAGAALLALPILTASDQVALSAAALAPLLALARALGAWAIESLRVAPAALEGLSSGLRGETVLGAAALALLVPAALGLRRVLSRASLRRR